jgi:signal transduction histidine kinase
MAFEIGSDPENATCRALLRSSRANASPQSLAFRPHSTDDAEPNPEARVERERLSVLVVEDNPTDVDLVRVLLDEAGPVAAGAVCPEVHHVETLHGAIAALAPSFDVALLDLGLPDASGLQAVHALHSASPGLPIVVLTGSRDPVLCAQALVAGAHDFLVKGTFDGELLLRCLRFAVVRTQHVLRWTQLVAERAAHAESEVRRAAAQALADENARLAREAQDLNATLVRQAHDLAELNRELEAFVYSVSHDLRAPLRSITGFSAAVLEDYGDRLDATGRQYLELACQGGRELSRLIDDVLSLSSVSTVELARDRVDLAAMAREHAEELRRSEPSRAVTFDIAPDLVARGDPSLLRTVVQNLLGNAWKFTSRHATARIAVGEAVSRGRRAFFVADDGAGFDMAYAHKLLRPFHRLHAAAEFAGSGIGLASVNRIVRRHGGEVWAEGAVEKGATIYFTLPGDHR